MAGCSVRVGEQLGHCQSLTQESFRGGGARATTDVARVQTNNFTTHKESLWDGDMLLHATPRDLQEDLGVRFVPASRSTDDDDASLAQANTHARTLCRSTAEQASTCCSTSSSSPERNPQLPLFAVQLKTPFLPAVAHGWVCWPIKLV